MLDFLIQRGSEQSVGIARDDMYSKLVNLEKFTSVSAEGRDHGLNVRHRYPLTTLFTFRNFQDDQLLILGFPLKGDIKLRRLLCAHQKMIYILECLILLCSREGNNEGASNTRRQMTTTIDACRSKAIKELLMDKERLKSVRAEHEKKSAAYQGYSRDQLSTSKAFHDDQDLPSPLSTARAPSLRRTVSKLSAVNRNLAGYCSIGKFCHKVLCSFSLEAYAELCTSTKQECSPELDLSCRETAKPAKL